MKKVKKIMALMLAMIMVMGTLSIATFAAEGAPTDKSIKVTGLETGDKVNFYQV